MTAIEIINERLGLGGSVTIAGDEFKCYVRDEDGGVHKRYLDAHECARLSDAFRRLGIALTTPELPEEPKR